jgi:excisionase family DNA binding protein
MSLPPLLITMAEAERILSLDDNTIRKLMARGEIGTLKIGRALRIEYPSIVSYLKRLRDEQNNRLPTHCESPANFWSVLLQHQEALNELAMALQCVGSPPEPE